MKPLSACTSIVGVADTGLRMVVRELLISLKLRDIEYVSDTDALLQSFRRKPGVDLIIMQNDLPPGGGCFAVAQSVRWDKMSPNRNVPIVSIGRDWTSHLLIEAREVGINEVVAMPTSIHTVQRKLVSALDPERPFVSVDDFRGPCRRRRAAGHQGPFRRGVDRIAEQLHNAEDKSARRAEKLEKLAAAHRSEEGPAPFPSHSSSLRRPEPAVAVPPEAKFLAQDRLNDFDGKSKSVRPPQAQPVPPPSTDVQATVKEGSPSPAPLPAPKLPVQPPAVSSVPDSDSTPAPREEAASSPPPSPPVAHPSEGLSNPKESPSVASDKPDPRGRDASEPGAVRRRDEPSSSPSHGAMPSPRPTPPRSDYSGGETKPERETKALPSDVEPPARQASSTTAPAAPPASPAPEPPTRHEAGPAPTPPLRPASPDAKTEPELPAIASMDAAGSPSPPRHREGQSADPSDGVSMPEKKGATAPAPVTPAAITALSPSAAGGGHAAGGGGMPSNAVATDPVVLLPPTVPMTQADLFKMLSAKKKKP